MIKKTIALLLLPFIVFGQTPKVVSGRIEHFEKFKSTFVTPRNVDVWLPEGYSAKNKYAVLYMNDGQQLFDSSVAEGKIAWGVDETLTRLINEGKIKNCIVVAVWNADSLRHSDYFPQQPFETFSKMQQDSLYKVGFNAKPMLAAKIQSDNYLKFLIKELKPTIDAKFSTFKSRENTFIAGSSMGGLISLYAMCEYPDIFGGAACLSTWWPGLLPSKNNTTPNAFNTYLQNNLPPADNHKLYFDNGTIGFDYFIKSLQPIADSIVLNKGYGNENFLSKQFDGADQKVKFWKSRFEIPMLFLLKKEIPGL